MIKDLNAEHIKNSLSSRRRPLYLKIGKTFGRLFTKNIKTLKYKYFNIFQYNNIENTFNVIRRQRNAN